MRDLRAFQRAEPLYLELVSKYGPMEPAVVRLAHAMELLAQGCHSYHATEKVSHYIAAREEAAVAVTNLLLGAPADNGERIELSARLEQEVLPAIGGLIRGAERRGRQRRFDLAVGGVLGQRRRGN